MLASEAYGKVFRGCEDCWLEPKWCSPCSDSYSLGGRAPCYKPSDVEIHIALRTGKLHRAREVHAVEAAQFNKSQENKPTPLDHKQVGGDHYKKHRFTPWDIIDEYGLDFYGGNALKYILRAKDKNGLEDLKKAKHYLEKMIELQEKKS